MKVLILFILASCLTAQPIAEQPAGSWIQRYQKPDMSAVVHCYENGFVWDRFTGNGMVFNGHPGIFSGMSEVALVEILHTNQTWLYSHETGRFDKTLPWDKPQKRCGAKSYFDQGMRRMVIYGGGGVSFTDNDYYEVGVDGKSLVEEVQEGLGKARLPWAFDARTKQWTQMRCLLEGLSDDNNWWGYAVNWIYIPEYGIAMAIPPDLSMVYFYCLHANSWSVMTTLNSTQAPPYTASMPGCYDRKSNRAVMVAGSQTYAFDFHARTWEKITATPAPSLGSQSWYDAWTSMGFDENSGRSILVTEGGDSTWAFDYASKQWSLESTSGSPVSAGSMGEGLTYDANNRVMMLYTSVSDRVYSYRKDAVDSQAIGEVENMNAVTSPQNVIVSWDPPSTGPAPDKYHVYRARWYDHKNQARPLDPGAYALIDSTVATTYSDAPADSAFTFYSYSVRAATGGRTGFMSTPAFSRRPAPLGLVATVFSRSRVGLKWVADTAPDVAGYNVYRKYGAIPRYNQLQKLNSAPVGPAPVFIDSLVNLLRDTIATYIVTTVNLKGQESGLSPRADTRIDRVMGIWADTASRTLNWSRPLADTFMHYEVWGKLVGNSTTKPIFNRLATGLHDTFYTYAANEVYHYKVRVTNVLGQPGHFSDLVPVADRYDDALGFWRGDGMFEPPVYDTFWDKLGKAPDVAVETRRPPAKGFSPFMRVSPNPFQTSTLVRVIGDLEEHVRAGRVSAAVYDACGRKVADLANEGYNRAECRFAWEAGSAPSGIYFARVSIGRKSYQTKLLLAR